MLILSAFDHVDECPVRRGSISHCICRDENVRKWRMDLRGFEPFAIIAQSRDQARMAAFYQAKEAGYYTKFMDFIKDINSMKRMQWTDEP